MRIWAVRKKVKIKGGCSATQTYKSRESLDGVSEYEPWHEISNNVVCATSKGSDQPAHMRSLIRAFSSRMNIL